MNKNYFVANIIKHISVSHALYTMHVYHIAYYITFRLFIHPLYMQFDISDE